MRTVRKMGVVEGDFKGPNKAMIWVLGENGMKRWMK